MPRASLDPVTLEVIRNRLDAVAQEMQDALVRSGYSNIIKEGHDCSAAMFNEKGELIAQATALPAQLGVLPPAVRRVLREHPVVSMRAGDVFILNDPYDGGTHLPDICMIAPIVKDGKPIAFAACISHHQDVGGKSPGSLPTDSTDIFQEGLRIPLVKFHEGGEPNPVVQAFIKLNVRVPDIVMGDLGAQLAALHVGSRRMLVLAEEHGTESLESYFSELLDRAELLTRKAISRIRPGTYVFEDYLDSDGIDLDKLVRIKASVTVTESELHIDFTGSDSQAKGPVNADKSAVMSAIYYVVKAIGDPTAPNNGGCFRPVHAVLPEGSVVNPVSPAPVNGRTITMKRIVDTILGALVQAMPGTIPAAPSGLVRVLIFGGTDSATNQRYICTDFTTGGTGGQLTRDGVDSLETDIANTMNMSAESLELHYPIRVHRNVLWRDSGGAGRTRGGLGVEREIEVLRGDATMTLREDRHRTRGWGLYGGHPAALARAEIIRGGEAQEIPSKGVFAVRAGDHIHCWTSGGAGYGDPLEREPDRVLTDLIDGKISPAAAYGHYGIVLTGDANLVDLGASEERRNQLRRSRGEINWTYDRGEMGRQ
jgi:N-methylhydantoinase B/oxoprolinase/acetone carboxylase alpha subunit